jgi:ABC-type transport system substrate-binding protein
MNTVTRVLTSSGKRMRCLAILAIGMLGIAVTGCSNSPLPIGAENENTLYTNFQERSPKYHDPTSSYANNETPITYNVYESLYTYHYLKRPFELVPKLATSLPKVTYLDKDGKPLPEDANVDAIAESVYEIPIRKGVKYASHPAFARDEKGEFRYHHLTKEQLGKKRTPYDFEYQGTREMTADDIVYALKRHATTRTQAPIFSVFAENIIGLKEYGELIKEEDKKLLAGVPKDSLDKPFLDFRKWPLSGAAAPDPYTLRLRIKGKYPQMKFWMGMTFFAPIPWEVEEFYAQSGMAFNGLTLNIWPAGTGPYILKEYEQDRYHVLVRNPNYRGDSYPCEGKAGDKEKGLLDDCGKPVPFIDKMVFKSDKEAVPTKAKFRGGYYDVLEFERDDWGQQFLDDMNSDDAIRKEYTEKGFQIPRDLGTTIWYWGFNMLDPVVGKGDTPEQQVKNRKLRQAVSIAMDWDEWSAVFPRKAGEAAHGPMPPGLFGSRHGTKEGMNPVTHTWVDDGKGGGKAVRRPIEDAKKLMVEAGYPEGRDAKTGKPLVLNYDFQRALTPELKAEVDWVAKQYAKLNIQLEIRATDFNQYQDKKRKGTMQFTNGGWFADYPDPENFLFLLYGPSGSAKFDGDNIMNYSNPEFDKMFDRMKSLDNTPERQELIDKMVNILREDAVWSFGYIPYSTGLYQSWLKNGLVTNMYRDQAKYYRLDSKLRTQKIAEWNKPVYWPFGIFALIAVLMFFAAQSSFRRRERMSGRGQVVEQGA